MTDAQIRSLVFAVAEEFGEHAVLCELINHVPADVLASFLASMEPQD